MKGNKIVLILTTLLFLAGFISLEVRGEEKQITIIYTNDLRGEIEPCG
jgi:hypothetical protein